MIKRQYGFTLLEMLVVLGIIGLIMGIAVSSFSTAQKKARDSKRKSDLKTIQNALEQYYSVCGYKYPTPDSSKLFTVICVNPSIEMLPTTSLPRDPKTDVSYVYTGDGSSYQLCIPVRLNATPPVFESESGASTYCITNQQ